MRYPILTVCQAKVDSMHYTLHWHPRREVNSTVEWSRSRWWLVAAIPIVSMAFSHVLACGSFAV